MVMAMGMETGARTRMMLSGKTAGVVDKHRDSSSPTSAATMCLTINSRRGDVLVRCGWAEGGAGELTKG
jgi:hypothetical protein